MITVTAAGATTTTLYDANIGSFNSAGKLCVKNLGAGTVTLATTSAQTIGGSATATIATNGISCVKPYVSNPAAGGAQWIQVQ